MLLLLILFVLSCFSRFIGYDEDSSLLLFVEVKFQIEIFSFYNSSIGGNMLPICSRRTEVPNSKINDKTACKTYDRLHPNMMFLFISFLALIRMMIILLSIEI